MSLSSPDTNILCFSGLGILLGLIFLKMHLVLVSVEEGGITQSFHKSKYQEPTNQPCFYDQCQSAFLDHGTLRLHKISWELS
jgi:hypothetical protein